MYWIYYCCVFVCLYGLFIYFKYLFPLGTGICWNMIPDSLDQVESQMDSNAIYYFEFQTWNLALQPA